MERFCLVILIVAIGFSAYSQQKNSKAIDKATGNELTPHIAINRKDPDNWIASLGNRVVYTLNGGKSWTAAKMRSSLANYGDPCLMSNGRGDFVYIQSAGPGKNSTDSVRDRLVSRSTPDGGITWSEESVFGYHPHHGQARPRAGMEKGTLYVTWTDFDHDARSDSACRANILFSMTSSEGKKWSDPVQINTIPGKCQHQGEGLQGQAPAQSAEGKLFMLWTNQGTVYMDRSYDGGRTWLSNDLAVSKAHTVLVINVPGVQRTMIVPGFAVDRSMSYFKSSLYAVWADQSRGPDDTDIWFSRSTNRGDFWTEPQLINPDSSRHHQFLPSLVVDEVTGVVYVAYYDRRAATDWQTDVYLAYSVDGGSKFKEIKLNETSFSPTEEKLLEGPVALDVYKGSIVAAWTRVDGGNVSLWCASLNQRDLISKEELPRLQPIRRN